MRICIVYDCLFPWTVGGGERWYRDLARRLADDGHDVTYVTLRQWQRGDDASFGGVAVKAVGPRMTLYTGTRRRILPPLVFGAGVLAHLARRGRGYDIVHTASFPFFSLLAAGLLRRVCGYTIVVDWFEVWSREYWHAYLGRFGGLAGRAVQALCIRLPQRAFCFSRLHRDRLIARHVRGEVTVLDGAYAGELATPDPLPAASLVVFAGRHIPEKRVPALVPAIRRARDVLPELRAVIFGDGPDRPAVLAAIAREDMAHAIDAPGFAASEALETALRSALCMVLPSVREGYGLIVIEAAAAGVPSVVVRAPDNAAVELVTEGVNGFVVGSAEPADIAEAIVRVHAAGPDLRASTAEWFGHNAERLSLDASLDRVVASYARRD
jgi:glycosyltransferase involved in cell wall biosynthesis